MPNYTFNKLTLRGSSSEVARFMDDNKSEETDEIGSPVPLSFEKLVPTPPEMLESNDWYNWRLENWGTKWDALDVHIPLRCNQFGASSRWSEVPNVLEFNTAWSPPVPWVVAVSEKYDLEFMLEYEGDDFSGYVIVKNGHVTKEEDLSNVLTKEIAEEWIADEDSYDLAEFEAIDDAAAESLSKHKGELHLDGLTKLSGAAAESLSKYKGDLVLSGLTELSDAVAESLSKHNGWLELNGLTELSDAAAESLSKHNGELYLWNLTELSDAAIESLSNHKGGINDQDPREWAEEFKANQ